jgi:3-oxo-5-alpha-steroid 4-dehydrogenase 1
MMAESLYIMMIWASFPLAFGVFVTLLFVTAPYGRHKRRGWGPSVSNRLGWLVMESPAVFIFLGCFLLGSAPKSPAAIIFLAIWEVHYGYRAFIYPFRILERKRSLPATIAIMGMLFSAGNAFINGSYLFELSGGYPHNWVQQPQMVVGLIVFCAGLRINHWADAVLRSLRSSSKDAYGIPQGGLYRLVSCPNYLGETIAWGGWAIATWSLPGLAFAVWTFANLVPRARAHHAWYRQNFPEYPPRRKALIPGIW